MKLNPPDLLEIFSCPLCNIELNYLSKRKKFISLTLFTTIDTILFTVYVDYSEGYSRIYKFIGNTEDDFVVAFDYALDVSPLNINDKLKTILTFM